MHGSAEDGGSFQGSWQLLVTDIPSSALEDLSALVVHDLSQDISSHMPDLGGEVVTLTHLPRSRWETLLNLDVIQVSFYIDFHFLHVHSTRIISNETSQKSLRRLLRRRLFSCLHLETLKHGFWFKRKKRRRHPPKNPKNMSQVQRACSFKSFRRSQKMAIVCVPSFCDDCSHTLVRRSILHFHEVTLPRSSRSRNSLFSDRSGFKSFSALPFTTFRVSSRF